MNKYEFLLIEQQSGRLDQYIKLKLVKICIYWWMDLFAYHLEHPEASERQVAEEFDCDRKMVRYIYDFMGGE